MQKNKEERLIRQRKVMRHVQYLLGKKGFSDWLRFTNSKQEPAPKEPSTKKI